jgi:hypothetical protein
VAPLCQGWQFSLLPDLLQWLQFSVQLIFLRGSLERTGYDLRPKGAKAQRHKGAKAQRHKGEKA